jgi:hypothetical protein
MFSKSELWNIVNTKISQDETLGEQAGSSGHLADVSSEVKDISEPKKVETDKGQGWEITYFYAIHVTTEFTYYPDNPPYVYRYKKTIVIDDKGNIIKESKKERI